MKRIHIAAIVAFIVAIAAASFLAGKLTRTVDHAPSNATAGASSGERKVLYWHDPMVPGPRFDKPGRSPFMNMQLVPVYADEQAATGVKVDPQLQQNLGIRMARVTRTQVSDSFEAVGSVQFDERLTVTVQTRVAGYVERLLVRAPMESVRLGQGLAVIYAPDWLGPQNEYLALQRVGASSDLIDAARDRMRALSIPQALIRESEQAGTAVARFTVSAPASGVVIDLGVREGAAVNPGLTLFRIGGLEKVWAVAELPEAQAGRLSRGMKVKAALQADGRQTFQGELKEIVPQVNANTRTLQARFEVANKGARLSPGMLLQLELAGPAISRLVMPSEAVIRTGTRALVIVRNPAGNFESREVQTGADLGDNVEVLKGLAEGDQVVASGQFLIDSEARLKSVLGAMGTTTTAATVTASAAIPAGPTGVHIAEGKVESVESDGFTISHGPVPSLKWPEMTMGFGKSNPKAFPNVKAGDTVRFKFRQGGPMGYEMLEVEKTGGGK